MIIFYKLCEMWHDNPDESSVIQKFIDYTFKNKGNMPRTCNCIDVSENIFSKFFSELVAYE